MKPWDLLVSSWRWTSTGKSRSQGAANSSSSEEDRVVFGGEVGGQRLVRDGRLDGLHRLLGGRHGVRADLIWRASGTDRKSRSLGEPFVSGERPSLRV